jgi:hypothetical protein
MMSGLTVLIIRHAEKPDTHNLDLGPGLTRSGQENKHSLVIHGWQRAGAWAALFGTGNGGSDFPKPDIVYAANPEQPASDDGSHSKRPLETITPLCERLHIRPHITLGVGNEGELVAEIEKLTGVVLVCWEHKRIIKGIVPALAKNQTILHLPTEWDATRFDVVLRFTRVAVGAAWSFRELFPQLMPGDSDVPLAKDGK